MPKVSVIVPVFDPGENITELIDSLLGQSMPPGECELIFVDDGSTDGTGARLDALAARHAHVKVEHIPNSGWPGRPRNVGLELASGEFVYFADNDDWLGSEALERLHATAVTDEADIVVGKVVGHGKSVPRAMFARNEHFLGPDSAPFGLLTPHKLFRRALIDAHGLRFPEGRRRLEDHAFVVPALFAAQRVAILADYPCYHWMRRDAGVNASFQAPDAEGYYDNVREVLDVVDAHTEPGSRRDALHIRWYAGKLLGRLAGQSLWQREPGYRADVLAACRALQADRFPPRLDARLTFAHRVRAALLRRDDVEGLERMAAFERDLRATARVRRIRGDGTFLSLPVRGRIWSVGEDEPLAFTRAGDRVRWAPPPALAARLSAEELDATGKLADGHVRAFLQAADGTEWDLGAEASVRLADAAPPDREAKSGRPEPTVSEGLPPGAEPVRLRPTVSALVRVAPTVAAGGAPLAPGDYELRVLVAVAGFVYPARTRVEDELFVVSVPRVGRVVPSHPAEPLPVAPPPPPPGPPVVRARRAAFRRARRVPGLLPGLRRARRLARARRPARG